MKKIRHCLAGETIEVGDLLGMDIDNKKAFVPVRHCIGENCGEMQYHMQKEDGFLGIFREIAVGLTV